MHDAQTLKVTMVKMKLMALPLIETAAGYFTVEELQFLKRMSEKDLADPQTKEMIDYRSLLEVYIKVSDQLTAFKELQQLPTELNG